MEHLGAASKPTNCYDEGMANQQKQNEKAGGSGSSLFTIVLVVVAIAILVAIISWPRGGGGGEKQDETPVAANTEPTEPAEQEPAETADPSRSPVSDEPSGEPAPDSPLTTSRFSPDAARRAQGLTPPGSPVLTFTKLEHDFGAMSDTETRECTFEFTNTGESNLKITKLTAACACTDTVMEKWDYLPGESGTIKTTFKPTRGGQRREVIAIVSNSKPDSLMKLYVTATVTEFLTIEPKTVHFGSVTRGAEHKRRFSVSCANRNLLIEEVTSTNPHVIATLLEANPATGQVPVDVRLDADAPWGLILNTRLQFIARGTLEDGREVEKEASVLVLGKVFDEFRAEPGILSLGPLLPGQEFRKEVAIRRIDLQPFEMVGASIQNAELAEMSLTIRPEPGGQSTQYRIILTGTAGMEDGFVQGVVRFIAKAPDGSAEPREIAITGKIDSELGQRDPM